MKKETREIAPIDFAKFVPILTPFTLHLVFMFAGSVFYLMLVVSKNIVLSFGLFFLIICDVYLNPWTLVRVSIVPEYTLDPMYV